jgi:type IV secretory pathway VirB2 component (pilin)
MPEHIDEHEEGQVTAHAVRRTDNLEAKAAAQASMENVNEEAKREIAKQVLRSLDSQTQKDVVRELQLLPAEQRRAIANSLMPTQPVTWIWKVTVGVFACVFVLATISLCVGALWSRGDVQTLLTVVTTVAGILAGFISGRASTGGTPS